MNLDRLVAWVADADEPRGRAVALALSSRGARVLVTGANERAIAECVGEIAHAGGKARHFLGDARTEAGARACVEAAVARFGEVHVAVVGDAPEVAARARVEASGVMRVVTLDAAQDEAAALTVVLGAVAQI